MRLVSCIMVACLMLSADPASAEWLADVYVGQSLTKDSDVTGHSAPGQTVFRDVEFDRSLAYGGRFGRYFDSVPFLGLAVDYFNFSPRIGPQAVNIDGCVPGGACGGGPSGIQKIAIESIGLSLDVMLRLPLLKTQTAPYGALQPYVLGGAPLFITTITPRTTRLYRNHQDDTDFSFGYKLGGGLAFHIARNLMVFGEYRYTHVEVSAGDLESADTGRAGHARFKTDLDSHSALVGLSARW
jgi:opacity protein-like surface antigen